MISYFILNKSGSIIYQSLDAEDATDTSRIRYLPLLLIKDLIKANLHSQIQHVKASGKLVAFWERHNLLFIACTKHKRIPVPVLHKHLNVMDNFLRFNFGPQWQLRLRNDSSTARSTRSLHPTLTTVRVAACLSQLPFLASHCTLRSHQCLCLIEQVDLQEELSLRLTDLLQDCCNTIFPPPPQPTRSSGNKLSAFFSAAPRRTTPTVTNHLHLHQQQHQNQHQRHHALHHHATKHRSHIEKDVPLGNWNHAFLFAREKVVIHCCNKDQQQNNPITNELLYYLKLLVSDYILENEEYDTAEQELHLKQQHDISAPQTITSNTSTANDIPPDTDELVSSSTSSPTLCTSTSTNNTPSQKSSLFSYIYDSSSASPFKIQAKSTVTQVSPSTTTVPLISWSNPPALVHSHLLSRLPKTHHVDNSANASIVSARDADDSLLREMSVAMKVTSLTPSLDHHYQHHHQPERQHQQQLEDTPLPPNAKALYQRYHPTSSSPTSPSLSHASIPNFNSNSTAYLSSSVPSHAATTFATITTNNSNGNASSNRNSGNHDDIYIESPILRRASANSSPLGRSRRQSMADHQHLLLVKRLSHQSDPSDDGSQDEHHPQYQQQKQPRQRDDTKVFQRWVKHGTRIIMTRICLTQITNGLVAILLFSDETLPSSALVPSSSKSTIWHHRKQSQQQQQMKQFILTLRSCLQDFTSFLLTKESVHFTILSFALTYPGLVHFIHIRKGIISSPQLVDLNDRDKHHEILHEIYEIYDIPSVTTIDTVIGKWRWPTVPRLKRLCGDMLYAGLSSRLSPPSIHTLQASTHHHQGFQYMYLSSQQQQRQQHAMQQQYHETQGSIEQDPGDELLAVYFSFVPKDRIWAMHQQLLVDVSQRHFMK